MKNQYNFKGENNSTQILHVADCREKLRGWAKESIFAKKMGSYNLIIADPPYRIKSAKNFGVHANRNYGNDMEPPEYKDWIPYALELLKPNGSMFIFEHPNNYLNLTDYLRSSSPFRDNIIVKPALIWFVSFRKSHPYKGEYNSHYEPICWVVRSEQPHYFDNKPLRGLGSHFGGDVMMAAAVMKTPVPGTKPMKIIKRLIEVHTKPGERVLDIFGGSLTVLKACQELGRDCVTIEINEETAKKAIKYRDMKGRNS